MSFFSDQSSGAAALRLPRPRIRLPFLHELQSYSWEKFHRDLIAEATLTLV